MLEEIKKNKIVAQTVRNICEGLGANEIELSAIAKLQQDNEKLTDEGRKLISQNFLWQNKIEEIEQALASLQMEHTRLLDVATRNNTKDPLEDLWTNRHPRVRKTYACRVLRTLLKGELKQDIISVDVLDFWQHKGKSVQDTASMIRALNAEHVKNADYDTLAWVAEKWVKDNIKYRGDKFVEGFDEYWQFPHETYVLRSGDCEDGAIYLANLMLAIGIPYWRVRLNVGPVRGGLHAYATYCRQSDNQFTTADWCYWTTTKKMPERKMHKDQRDYYGITFSWDLTSAYEKTEYEDVKP